MKKHVSLSLHIPFVTLTSVSPPHTDIGDWSCKRIVSCSKVSFLLHSRKKHTGARERANKWSALLTCFHVDSLQVPNSVPYEVQRVGGGYFFACAKKTRVFRNIPLKCFLFFEYSKCFRVFPPHPSLTAFALNVITSLTPKKTLHRNPSKVWKWKKY